MKKYLMYMRETQWTVYSEEWARDQSLCLPDLYRFAGGIDMHFDLDEFGEVRMEFTPACGVVVVYLVSHGKYRYAQFCNGERFLLERMFGEVT